MPAGRRKKPSRFRVEKVEVGDGIYGLDHPWTIDHRVVETATGNVDRVALPSGGTAPAARGGHSGSDSEGRKR